MLASLGDEHASMSSLAAGAEALHDVLCEYFGGIMELVRAD